MSTPQQRLLSYIHHERQEKGSMLCAQHALNSLLQGQYYDASQLAQIANELDELQVTELGISAADMASRDRSSLNMDDTGFFSVSVLERALQIWGLSLTNWRSAEMRMRTRHPEDEKAFVLNLDSHWFTIRSFGKTSRFWYNLNSFLAEPSWIGTSYLGTLLHTAEAEGYSVFVVYPSEGSKGQSLEESDADQIADHLPPPGASSSSSSADATNIGLRPDTTAAVNDDPELQAALTASMMQSSTITDSPSSRSRVRQTRSVSDDSTLGGGGAIETDADIDAIAPSRRRHRAAARDESHPPIPLTSDAVDEDLRRAMEASLAGSMRSTDSPNGATSSSSSRPIGRRKRRAQERQSGLTQDEAIDLDESRDDHPSDANLHPASSSYRSPFLSPAMLAANRDNEDVEELLEDVGSDDDIDPFSVPGAPEASAVIGPRQNRDYDDEDAELQAALAASLGDDEAATRFETGLYSNSTRGGAQDETPIPADVDRIFKMRQEARKLAQTESEQQARRERGEEEPVLPDHNKDVNNNVRGDHDAEDEAEEEEVVSAEELRRRRLARFG